MPYKDLEVRNAYARQYHKKHRDILLLKMHQRYLKNREARLLKAKQYNETHKEIKYPRDKKWRDKMKLDVLSHYSNGVPVCVNCGIGDIDMLCLDHLNGGGAKQRKQGLIGQKIYRWVIKNNYPLGFQVLCANCNLKKSIQGILGNNDFKTRWVLLAEDQTPPENPFNSKKSGLEASAYNGFEVAKLRYRGWRKVELGG